MNPLQAKTELLNHYTDSNGAVSLYYDPKPESVANPILFTAIALHLMYKQNVLETSDIVRFNKFLDKVQVQPGLYHRNPTWVKYYCPHDDATGIMALKKDKLLSRGRFAIFNYGRDHFPWFNYNNVKPGEFKWECQRLPHHIYQYYRGVDKKPFILIRPFFQLWSAGAIYLAGRGGNISNQIQAWLHLEVVRDDNWLFRWVNKKFNKMLDEQHRALITSHECYNGVEAAFAKYYGKAVGVRPAEHPIRWLARGVV